MTSKEVKDNLKNFLKQEISEIKQIVYFDFPISFPALIIEEPTVEKKWIGFAILEEEFNVRVSLVAPSGINRDTTITKLNDIQQKISEKLLNNPTCNQVFTSVKIKNTEANRIVLKENEDQSAEIIGMVMNIVVNNIIIGG